MLKGSYSLSIYKGTPGIGAHVALEFTRAKALMYQFYLYKFRSPIPRVSIFITNSTCTQIVFSSQNLAVWRSIILKRIRDFLTEGPMYCQQPLSHKYIISSRLLYCLAVIDLFFPVNVPVGLYMIHINCE